MNWKELAAKYEESYSGKQKNDHIRMRAFKNIEKIISENFKDIFIDPTMLLNIERTIFKKDISKFKTVKRLNGPEISAINFIYDRLEKKPNLNKEINND